MRIYKNDMTVEQLERVYDTNEKLQEIVTDDYMEDMVMHTVGEYLEPLKHLLDDWSIGYGQHNVLYIRDDIRLPHAVRELQQDFGFLSDEDYQEVEKTIKEIESYEDTDFESDDVMYSTLADLEQQSNHVRDMLMEQFDELLRYPTQEEMKDYFLEYYAECRLDADVYIDNGTYTLYKEVAYTESYI